MSNLVPVAAFGNAVNKESARGGKVCVSLRTVPPKVSAGRAETYMGLHQHTTEYGGYTAAGVRAIWLLQEVLCIPKATARSSTRPLRSICTLLSAPLLPLLIEPRQDVKCLRR